ncbi:MAG: cytochrome b5 [Deltaproteobacteria bacterium]|nr:cytochrome b5 [Deltaproteobacteria bacterium]
MAEELKEFTVEDLAEFNGADGKPVYIAYQGRVYDVSGSELWAGGEHMTGHAAGADLSAELPEAPHGEEVFERYPLVGILKASPESTAPQAETARKPRPGFWARFLKRFPLFRRHPHPMTVHFPIVFFISAPVFALLYLLTSNAAFETTAWHCLGGGVLFTPVALITGLLTWWLNYELRPLRPVIIKLTLTPILLTVGTGTFIWRWLNPGILAALDHWTGKVFLVLIFSLLPLVSLVGWYGATLTFPLHEE